jgi:hypothetical protein
MNRKGDGVELPTREHPCRESGIYLEITGEFISQNRQNLHTMHQKAAGSSWDKGT